MIFKNEDMTEKRIKVVMTPAGTEWSAEKEYKLLDYISDGTAVWLCVNATWLR